VYPVAPGETVRRTREGTYVVVREAQGRSEGRASMPEELVITPGGLRPKSLVHHMAPQAVLDLTDCHQRILDRSGKILADLGVVEIRPTGIPLMPRNVVHPPRTEQDARAVPAPLPAFGSGWITYASWANGTGNPVSFFTTTWTVPAAPPSSSGQTVFLFNGIQNSWGIYQPVLQWGPSGAGGGNNWAVASWYVGFDGSAFHSTLVGVNPGDVLVGVMTLTGQSAAGFSYNSQFQGIANTNLAIQNVPQLTWCVETLECYGITKCSDYLETPKTAMSAIDIQTGTTRPSLAWTITDAATECGQHTLRFDDDLPSGEVDLWNRSGPFWTAGSGTIAPHASQEWWFSWGGDGDVGPQLIQAEPLNAPSQLATTQIAVDRDASGHLTYHATVVNKGSVAVNFQWRGGGR
jgi:hypothetical protein